jgi:cytochrome c
MRASGLGRTTTFCLVVLVFGGVISWPAASQEIGDPAKGLQFAMAVCSVCHAVTPEQPHSRLPQAPRFVDVANTSGMTANALTTWLQTSHPTMPNIILTDEEMRNVIQYIVSLKKE